MDILDLLARLRAVSGSDLHLVVGQPPVFRIAGTLERQGNEAIDAETLERILFSLVNDAGQEALYRNRDIEMTVRHEGSSYRLHAFYERGQLAVAVRAIPGKVPTMEQLGLGVKEAPVLHKLIQLKRGLIVVTGAVGSGKTTLVAGMLEEINRTRAERIATIENPIEYEFESQQSVITQRAIGEDVPDFPTALRSVIRMDPDIIWVSEPASVETVTLVLALVEAGHLVFLTMNMETASAAVNRIIEAFPEGQQAAIRRSVSRNLQAVIAQKLLARPEKGRVPAQEILIGYPRIRELILEGQTDFSEAMKQGDEFGIQTMDDAVLKHLAAGNISRSLALFHLEDKSRLSEADEDTTE